MLLDRGQECGPKVVAKKMVVPTTKEQKKSTNLMGMSSSGGRRNQKMLLASLFTLLGRGREGWRGVGRFCGVES